MAKETPKSNKNANWSRLRHVAAEEPKETANALAEAAEAFGTMADSLTNLRENLDLIEAPKTASVKARIASARKFASRFRRMAEEAPEVVADAISEVYYSSTDVVEALENLAENLGIDLVPEGEESMSDEGSMGEEHSESEDSPFEETSEEETSVTASKDKKAGPIMEKMTPEGAVGGGGGGLDKIRNFLYALSNADPQVHSLLSDPAVKNVLGKAARNKKASPIMEKMTPEGVLPGAGNGGIDKLRKLLYSLSNADPEIQSILADPSVKNLLNKAAGNKKADGGAAFITDRDEAGQPEAPEELEVPRVEVKEASAKREATRQRIAARHGITL